MPGGSPAIIAAVFRAVRTGNAFEETVERLLEGVKLGVYAPGDRLPPERELTRRLGVSRITLREALRELAAAGYVETKRGRFGGTFIIRMPEPMVPDEVSRTARELGHELDDALTFRRVVETGAAEMAARASLSRQQRESLAEALAAMAECGPSGYRQADTRLHLAIADAAGSPQLTASVVEAQGPAGRPAQRHPDAGAEPRARERPAREHRAGHPGRRPGAGPQGDGRARRRDRCSAPRVPRRLLRRRGFLASSGRYLA